VKIRDTADAVYMDLVRLVLGLLGLTDNSLGDSCEQCAVLLLCHEGANEEAALKIEKAIRELRRQLMALGVQELSFPVHFAILPATDVAVAYLVLQVGVISHLGPREFAVTVKLTVVQISLVFRAICEDEMAVTMLLVKVPDASIARLVRVDLDAVTVPQHLQLCFEFFGDQ